jgi:hypothetical protein
MLPKNLTFVCAIDTCSQVANKSMQSVIKGETCWLNSVRDKDFKTKEPLPLLSCDTSVLALGRISR